MKKTSYWNIKISIGDDDCLKIKEESDKVNIMDKLGIIELLKHDLINRLDKTEKK